MNLKSFRVGSLQRLIQRIIGTAEIPQVRLTSLPCAVTLQKLYAPLCQLAPLMQPLLTFQLTSLFMVHRSSGNLQVSHIQRRGTILIASVWRVVLARLLPSSL
jgi:hypothetical protein